MALSWCPGGCLSTVLSGLLPPNKTGGGQRPGKRGLPSWPALECTKGQGAPGPHPGPACTTQGPRTGGAWLWTGWKAPAAPAQAAFPRSLLGIWSRGSESSEGGAAPTPSGPTGSLCPFSQGHHARQSPDPRRSGLALGHHPRLSPASQNSQLSGRRCSPTFPGHLGEKAGFVPPGRAVTSGPPRPEC